MLTLLKRLSVGCAIASVATTAGFYQDGLEAQSPCYHCQTSSGCPQGVCNPIQGHSTGCGGGCDSCETSGGSCNEIIPPLALLAPDGSLIPSNVGSSAIAEGRTEALDPVWSRTYWSDMAVRRGVVPSMFLTSDFEVVEDGRSTVLVRRCDGWIVRRFHSSDMLNDLIRRVAVITS